MFQEATKIRSMRMTGDWNNPTVRKVKHRAEVVEESAVIWCWALRWSIPAPEWRKADFTCTAIHARTARARQCVWASTPARGAGCTTWTTPWMSCGVSFRTPIRHPCGSCPKSPLCCWPRTTSWCRPMPWKSCVVWWPTWTRRPDWPFRSLPPRLWPIRLLQSLRLRHPPLPAGPKLLMRTVHHSRSPISPYPDCSKETTTTSAAKVIRIPTNLPADSLSCGVVTLNGRKWMKMSTDFDETCAIG